MHLDLAHSAELAEMLTFISQWLGGTDHAQLTASFSRFIGTMFWVPFVTFWLVTTDLPFAASAPPGHGHVYTAEFVDGWNTVLESAGTTPAELAALRGIVANSG
jgi:uncharacterized membrane protein